MSARFPAGDGVWPAFWLIGRTDETTAELDVFEHHGAFPERYTVSVHVWDRSDPKLSRSQHFRIPVVRGSLSEGFHTCGVSVEADNIRFFFDRLEVWRVTTPAEFQRPLYVLVDLGLGGGWPIENAPNPSYMYVDYIRVWQKRS
jgi:beta-glucanase (GH16 family)